MTLTQINTEIEKHFSYWVESFNRKELNSNNARITGEYICKACIIHKKGEIGGMNIIQNQNPSIPQPTYKKASRNDDKLPFVDLIQCLRDIELFKNNIIPKSQFDILRSITNPASHSANSSEQLVTVKQLEICHDNLKPLMEWYFNFVINQPIPQKIQNALNGKPDLEYLSESSEKWRDFFTACYDFDRRYQYILISPESISENPSTVEAIAKLPWRLVLDFNPKSDSNEMGLLYHFNILKGSGYKKAFTLKSNKPDFDAEFPHYWFFANGDGSTVQSISEFKDWKKEYKTYLSDTLYSEFNKGSRPRTRIVVMLGILPRYASFIVSEFNRKDEENLKFIICPVAFESYDSIEDENVETLNISADEIADGINNNISFLKSNNQSSESKILVPIRKEDKAKAFVALTQDHFDYLHTLGIDIIFKGIENLPNTNQESDAFYKGATISWRDLYEQKDKSRNPTQSLLKKLREKLEGNILESIELIHQAGAGGTTLARRMAFELSTDFPTVILRKYENKKTIDGLRILIDGYTKGSLPLLIVLETFEVRDYQKLYGDLSNDHKKAIILQVKRGNTSLARDRKFILKSQLEANEVPMFEREFGLLTPVRKEQIDNIKTLYHDSPKYISAVLYALTAYGRDYDIKGYIRQCLHEVSTEQKQLVGFICLIHHFTQKSTPIELFTSLLGVDRRNCYLREIVKESPILDLLHEEWEEEENLNIWRPRYDILGEQAMKIILGGGVESEQNWKSNLARWLLDLIEYVGTAIPYLDEETKQILLTLFITRNGEDEEGGTNQSFTNAITILSNTDGKAIFETLTKIYPNEEAFHAHFARYLYDERIGIKDYDKAIEEAQLSLEIQNNSTLIHTLGMCYRKKAESLAHDFERMGLSAEETEYKIQALTDQAVETFEESISQDGKNIYGYESAMRAILNALDFGFQIHKAISKEDFLNTSKNQWYLERYDKAQLFLEDALFVIEQSKTLEEKARLIKSAGYIYECERRVFSIAGDHVKAKSKYENLVKNTPSGYQYMRPLYRRMYVTHLLYSKLPSPSKEIRHDISVAWKEISQNELEECITFLKANFTDDAANIQNIKWWLQANRYVKNPPSIEQCLVEISSWSQNTQQSILSQLEAYYYLYVMNAIKAIQSGNFDPSSLQIVKDIKEKIKQLPIQKNEKFCFEWYGTGVGIQQMVNHKLFGDFKPGFIDTNKHLLAEVTGRIKDIISPQTGTITLDCGLEAFFVPSHGAFTERNKTDRVKFYVGFRYDQIQAWSVIPIDKERGKEQIKHEYIEENDEVEDTVPELNQNLDTEEVLTELKGDKLKGLTVLGKIDLESNLRKEKEIKNSSQLITTEFDISDIPQQFKQYEGVVKTLNGYGGYIRCGLNKDVVFHKDRLKACNIEQLFIGTKVYVKIFFENENGKNIPSLDKRDNYKATEVCL